MSKALLLLALVVMAANHASAQLGSRLVQRMQGGQAARHQQPMMTQQQQHTTMEVGTGKCEDEWVTDKSK